MSSTTILHPLKAHLLTPFPTPRTSLPSLLHSYIHHLDTHSILPPSQNLILGLLRTFTQRSHPLTPRHMSALFWTAQHISDGAHATFVRLEWLRRDMDDPGLLPGLEDDGVGEALEEEGYVAQAVAEADGKVEGLRMVWDGGRVQTETETEGKGEMEGKGNEEMGEGKGKGRMETEEEGRARWARNVDAAMMRMREKDEDERLMRLVIEVVREMIEDLLWERGVRRLRRGGKMGGLRGGCVL